MIISKLASRLKGYKTPSGEKIKPRTIKLADGSTAKGYHRSDFEEAWKRWLPASPPSTVTNVTNVTFPGEKGDVEGTGCVEGDVTGQGNVTEFPSKVTTVTTVTTNQGEGEDSGETDEYAAQDCLRRQTVDHSTSPFPDMSDEEWLKYEAEFNASKTIYPGDWINLTPDETQEDWLAVLKQALKKPCEICGESMGGEEYLWYHRTRHVGRCPNCQETDWFADGYEIDEFGMPSCWSHRHTREKRIAERTRNQIQKAACYRARKAGLEYAAVYKALLAQEPEETRRMIEQLCEKERQEDEARATSVR